MVNLSPQEAEGRDSEFKPSTVYRDERSGTARTTQRDLPGKNKQTKTKQDHHSKEQ